MSRSEELHPTRVELSEAECRGLPRHWKLTASKERTAMEQVAMQRLARAEPGMGLACGGGGHELAGRYQRRSFLGASGKKDREDGSHLERLLGRRLTVCRLTGPQSGLASDADAAGEFVDDLGSDPESQAGAGLALGGD